MPLFFSELRIISMERVFNKHPNRSCAECGSDVESQKSVIGKQLPRKLLQE